MLRGGDVAMDNAVFAVSSASPEGDSLLAHYQKNLR
jgi:hypothetical protein